MVTKIHAEKSGDRILVNAKFLGEDGETIEHEINTAFPQGTEESVIREEVEKAGKLFELEKEQAKEQKKVDEVNEKDNDTINSLNEEEEE